MTRRRAFRVRTVGPLLGLAASVLMLPLLQLTLFQSFEQKTVDARMRVRVSAESAPEIAVCAIDSGSVDAYGQWPWPRSVMANLVRRLHAAGARAIALDVIFSEPSRLGREEDEALVAAVREAGNVVLGFYLTKEARPGKDDPGQERVPPSAVELSVLPPGGFPELPSYTGFETNIPILARAAPAAGHFIVPPDSDGTVRHYPLVLAHEGQLYPSLALRAVQVFLGSPPISVRPRQGLIPIIRLGDLTVPASERGELWVNFRGLYGETFPYPPIADVLAGRVPDSAFEDKLVFIGATETGLGDLATTPFDWVVPGVEIHATVADNLLHERFIRDGAPEMILGMLAVLVLGTLCGWSAGFFRRPLTGAATAIAILLTYAAFAQIVFSFLFRHIFLVVPLLAGAFGFTAAILWRNIFAEVNARLIRKVFRHFVSEGVMVEMLRNPEKLRLGGEKRELTVLFSDLRGFTSISERLPPEQVVSLLNAYMTPMTELIFERGGTLDKYMGDAIMAFFGAPVPQADHPIRACETALAMQTRLTELNAEWSSRGQPPFACGIGINTGPMAVGNMGSLTIFDYTVIGDHVNLGSRVERLTRLYGVKIAVTEYKEASVRGRFRFRELDRVRVKGKWEAVRIFELLEAGDGSDQEYLETFAAGLQAYRAGDFDRADSLFRSAAGLRPDDPPSRLYLKRTTHRRTAASSGTWDGVSDLSDA